VEDFRVIFISGGKNSPDGDWIEYKVYGHVRKPPLKPIRFALRARKGM